MAIRIDENTINGLLEKIEEKYDSVHIFYPPSQYLFQDKFLPFRPVLLDESTELGLSLMNIETLEITSLYIPEDDKIVIGVDVNESSQLLLSLASEEPDTPECIIIDSKEAACPIKLDCEDIWYQGYGSSLKWGETSDELLVINDFEEEETVVKLDLANNKVLDI